MCTNNNPLYLNNIFDETHPELIDLHENLQEFQNNFMGASYEDIETENIIETEVEDFHDDFDDEINNEVFSNVEIEKFKKICRIIKSNHHLSKSGGEEVINLAFGMNVSGKRKYEKEFLLKLLDKVKI